MGVRRRSPWPGLGSFTERGDLMDNTGFFRRRQCCLFGCFFFFPPPKIFSGEARENKFRARF